MKFHTGKCEALHTEGEVSNFFMCMLDYFLSLRKIVGLQEMILKKTSASGSAAVKKQIE